jgi:hypothetical protein
MPNPHTPGTGEKSTIDILRFSMSTRRSSVVCGACSMAPSGPSAGTDDGFLARSVVLIALDSLLLTQSESRVAGASALSSMWPIALATAAGRSSAGSRPPALGRGSLCRKASFPLYVV